MSIKFITLATLATLSLSTGLVVGSSYSEASAESFRLQSNRAQTQLTQRQPQIQPIQVQPNFQPALKLATPISMTGNWQGGMSSSGDDVVTHIELSIASGGNGTWKHNGSQYNPNTDQWEPKVLQQGSLSASLQGSAIAMQLNGFSGNNLLLEGTMQNGGTTMSGQVVGTPNFGFYLAKQ